MVPKTCQYLTAFIDVHARVLYYVVAAWEKQLGGGPIDYGTYPQQPVSYFSQDAAPVSMSDIHPGLVEDAWLMAGLGTLVDRLIKTVYQREDAVPMRIGRLFIDVKWGEKNRLLKSFCRRHQHAGTILWPAQGIGIGASGKPFSEYRPEPGAEVGLNWRIAPPVGGDRWVTVDTNFWKTFSATRLISPINTPGGWELFGRDPREHALFADHLCAEEPIEVQARGAHDL